MTDANTNHRRAAGLRPRILRVVHAAALLACAAGVARGELLLHYTFDEATGGTTAVLDQGAAPAAHGTFVGSAARTNDTPGGVSRGALDLARGADGVNHYVTPGNVPKLNALPQMTVTLWVNLRQNANNGDRLVAMGSAFDINFPSGGNTATALKLGFMINNNYQNSSGAFNALERWVFVAATWDGTTRRYYTGGEDRTNAVTQLAGTSGYSAASTPTVASAFRVSSTTLTSADRTPPAWIDDVRIYSTALTQQELEAVRRENITPKGTAVLVR